MSLWAMLDGEVVRRSRYSVTSRLHAMIKVKDGILKYIFQI